MSKPHPEATAKIDAYIAGLPTTWRDVCVRLRATVHRAAPELAEDWKWGVPCFSGRSLVCGFAAFKRHVTFDFWNGALLDDRHGILNHGAGNARGRGLRLSEGDPLPEKALAEYVRQAARLDAEGLEAPARKGRAQAVIVPEALGNALALEKNAKARAFFDSLPPSHRREFCGWIASAKRPQTVQRRLGVALEQLSRGERRHDRYRK